VTTATLIVVLLAGLAVMTGGFLAQAIARAIEVDKRRRAEQETLELRAEVESLRRRALMHVYDRENTTR